MISGLCLLRPALGMSGTIDLYLENSALDTNTQRSVNNVAVSVLGGMMALGSSRFCEIRL